MPAGPQMARGSSGGSHESRGSLGNVIVTGASGFIGRHLLDAIDPEYRVFAISRRNPTESCPSPQWKARWYHADISDPQHLAAVFREIHGECEIDAVIHLAAYYDFTGKRHPEYRRANVEGTRNVLALSREIGAGTFVLASSVAACAFPPYGSVVTETSSPDGENPYAQSKRLCERMVADYRQEIHCCIIRFAALFSDWCEYEPLFNFLETWLSRSPRRRILAGQGWSAIPFLHIRDATMFIRTLLPQLRSIESGSVVLASTDGAVSHCDLFAAATAACYGQRNTPLLLPRILCHPGLRVLDTVSRMTRFRSFERPWMSRLVDRQLNVDASATRRRLGWAPRERLNVIRRMPFLLENRKTFPCEWLDRSHASIRGRKKPANIRIHHLLERHQDEICSEFTEYLMDPDLWRRFHDYHRYTRIEHRCRHRPLLQALMNAVRTGEKGFFMSACRYLAEHRREQGFSLNEVTEALEVLNDICLFVLLDSEPDDSDRSALNDHIGMTIQFGIDAVCEVYEEAGDSEASAAEHYQGESPGNAVRRSSPRSQTTSRRGCFDPPGRADQR